MFASKLIALRSSKRSSKKTVYGVIAIFVLFGLNACGGGTTTTTPTTNTPAVSLSAASKAYVNLDIANLANYASPTLPPFYTDPAVIALDNTPANNPATNAKATLGRVLFYDRRLSRTDTVACANCHSQAEAFSDGDQFSTGFTPVGGNAGLTGAHSMRLANIRYYRPGTAFWDKRAASVEAQSTQPIQHAVEMGFDTANGGFAAVITKMNTLPYYPELFTFAFGDTAVTETRVQQALAQYMRSIVSVNSKWDTGYALNYDASLADKGRSLAIASFTASEERGRQLFINPPTPGGVGLGCAGCHVPPTFALTATSQSNGLDAGETKIFKAPSLKNAGVAGKFMHDGRFATLNEVVEHYASGVKLGPALDNRLITPAGAARTLPNLTAADKIALVAFLQTLTDTALPTDTKFSSPFVQ